MTTIHSVTAYGGGGIALWFGQAYLFGGAQGNLTAERYVQDTMSIKPILLTEKP